MVGTADYCCFTLALLQHYLCARHILTLPHSQRVAKLNQKTIPLHVWQFYIGLCSSFRRVKLVLKYQDTLMSAACISEIPVKELQDLMSSQLTFRNQWLTTINVQSIFQTVYHSGLPCKLHLQGCSFGPLAFGMIIKGLPIVPNGGTIQELR